MAVHFINIMLGTFMVFDNLCERASSFSPSSHLFYFSLLPYIHLLEYYQRTSIIVHFINIILVTFVMWERFIIFLFFTSSDFPVSLIKKKKKESGAGRVDVNDDNLISVRVFTCGRAAN